MKENRNERMFLIIIILLIIIIFILLFFSKFGKVEEKYLTPTGNVDVFDIDINCKCKDNETCIITDNDGNEIIIPTFNESIDKNVIGTVFVDDNNGNYIYQQKLNIFNNAVYEYTNKIAPGVSNTYYFVVHNSTNTELKYYLEMYESSEYKINLKYRLKRNNEYVIGNDNTWVTSSELKTEFSKFSSGSSDNYTLDWKWFDDDENDTIAGKNMTSEYKLNIRFYFDIA